MRNFWENFSGFTQLAMEKNENTMAARQLLIPCPRYGYSDLPHAIAR